MQHEKGYKWRECEQSKNNYGSKYAKLTYKFPDTQHGAPFTGQIEHFHIENVQMLGGE